MHGTLCEICQQRPATSHLTEVGSEPGQAQELHICRQCCKKLGLDLHAHPLPVAVIHEIRQQQDEDSGPVAKQLGPGIDINLNPSQSKALSLHHGSGSRREDPRCLHCGLTLSRFAKSNRFGCGRCYEAFADHLDQIFNEIHHGNRHCGRLPAAQSGSEQQRFTRRLHLRQRLDQAIAAEDYESAASLRDELKHLDTLDTGDESAERGGA